MEVSDKRAHGFHRLPEEILSLIVLQLDGQSIDINSLKSVRLAHPRFGHLEQAKQSLFRTLALPPRPDYSLWESALPIAPFVQELILVPTTSWYAHGSPFDELLVKVGAEMVSRFASEWRYADASGELGPTVGVLNHLQHVKHVVFRREDASTACQLDVRPRQIIYRTAGALSSTSDPYNVHEEAWGWSHDFWTRYNDDWRVAWHQINLQGLKDVHIDARTASPLQALVVLQTAFGRCDTGLGHLSTTRLLRDPEPISFPLWFLASGGPYAPFRHWGLYGGAVDFGHLAVWVSGNNDLIQLSYSDVFDDADAGGWFLLVQAIRQHRNRIQVRFTNVQIGPDKLIAKLEHNTADRLPVHEDDYCSMIMRYMSGVSEWDSDITGPTV